MTTAPRPTRLLPLLLAATLSFTAAAQQVVVGGALVTQREAAKTAVANYKLHGRFTLDQLLQLDAKDGTLNFTVNADLPDQTAAMRVEVEGSDATWVVRKRLLGAAAATTYLTLTRYDFDADNDRPWLTTLTVRSNYISLSSQAGDSANAFRVRLTQSNGNLTLNATRTGQGAQNVLFNLTATSLKQLQAEHPEEVRKYLAPLLHSVTGRTLLRPGAADVYRVFDKIPPDPAVARKLDDILVQLEADSYQARDRANQALHALGAPGVLAALRRDNADLSPEARNRLDLFVASRSNALLDDPAKARADGTFLIDCLDDDDPAVRAAAKAALEKLVNHPIDFDPTLTGDPRATAVDTLRRQLDKKIRPTTKPTRPTTPR